MRASVGDRYVQVSSVVGVPARDGRVVELRHPDGSPPFVVTWTDTGEQCLVFPGADAHLEPPAPAGPGARAADAVPATTTAMTWHIQVTVSHAGSDTSAQALLRAAEPGLVAATGRAHRNPHDASAPAIGEEIAVARALRRLADQLIDAAQDQIEDSTGRPARLHS